VASSAALIGLTSAVLLAQAMREYEATMMVATYEGAFVGGQLHGHGRFVWPDGSAYEGAFHFGTMNGQGRLDSRFDGRFLQGRFHRNCFQKQDGRWVDVLEQHRLEEQQQILEGDPNALLVKRCALALHRWWLLQGHTSGVPFSGRCRGTTT